MLPCPFCGDIPVFQFLGEWVIASPLDSKDWFIKCCNGIFVSRSDPRDVIQEWNKRFNG
jgi:sarcosine oxidase delta subunit